MALKTLKKTLANIIIAATVTLTPATIKAENYPEHVQWGRDNKTSARTAVLGANVAIGCIKSGIGSRINKSGFWNGCAKGALAGTVMSAGEYMATFAADKDSHPITGGLGKLIHDLGVSMSDNVMRGESMLSQYQTELGPLTLTFRDSITPRPSFTITPIAAIASNIIMGNKFDIKKSLYYFTPIFRVEKPMLFKTKEGAIDGYALGNVITYTSNRFYKGTTTLSHEFNHTLFWSKLRFCGDLLHQVPYMKDIEKDWNIGQELGYGLINLPILLDNKAHPYLPHEIEAYYMQRE